MSPARVLYAINPWRVARGAGGIWGVAGALPAPPPDAGTASASRRLGRLFKTVHFYTGRGAVVPRRMQNVRLDRLTGSRTSTNACGIGGASPEQPGEPRHRRQKLLLR